MTLKEARLLTDAELNAEMDKITEFMGQLEKAGIDFYSIQRDPNQEAICEAYSERTPINFTVIGSEQN